MTISSRTCLLVATVLGVAAATANVSAADPTPPKSYKQCVACHAYTAGGAEKIGPNLHGIVGRKVGGSKGFAYSSAAKAASFTWTEDRLKELLRNPKAYRKSLSKAAHNWRPAAAKTLEPELMPFFRAISPGASSK